MVAAAAGLAVTVPPAWWPRRSRGGRRVWRATKSGCSSARSSPPGDLPTVATACAAQGLSLGPAASRRVARRRGPLALPHPAHPPAASPRRVRGLRRAPRPTSAGRLHAPRGGRARPGQGGPCAPRTRRRGRCSARGGAGWPPRSRRSRCEPPGRGAFAVSIVSPPSARRRSPPTPAARAGRFLAAGDSWSGSPGRTAGHPPPCSGKAARHPRRTAVVRPGPRALTAMAGQVAAQGGVPSRRGPPTSFVRPPPVTPTTTPPTRHCSCAPPPHRTMSPFSYPPGRSPGP